MELKQLPLNKTDASNLQGWLERDEFQILVKVVNSMAFEKEAQAVNHLISNTSSSKAEADALLADARNLQSVSETLKKIRESKQLFVFTANPQK